VKKIRLGTMSLDNSGFLRGVSLKSESNTRDYEQNMNFVQ